MDNYLEDTRKRVYIKGVMIGSAYWYANAKELVQDYMRIHGCDFRPNQITFTPADYIWSDLFRISWDEIKKRVGCVDRISDEKPCNAPKSVPLPVDHSSSATVEDKNGAKQSSLPAAYELLPPHALTLVAMVQEHGAKKYREWNWRGIPTKDHIRHSIGHMMGAIAEDEQEDGMLLEYPPHVRHLAKAATRALYALETAYISLH